MAKKKTVRVVIEDAWRLKGRRPPAKLIPYFSTEEWSDLSGRIYTAILPAISLKYAIVYILTGLFAIPLLSFLFLIGFVVAGIVDIQVFTQDLEEEFTFNTGFYMHSDTDDYQEQTITKEEAFQLLLLITVCGCIGLSVLCLLIGSLLRNCYFRGLVEDNLTEIKLEFEELRDYSDDGISIELDVSQPERKGIQAGCRQAFMAWCDLDYDFRVSIRDTFDDYNRM